VSVALIVELLPDDMTLRRADHIAKRDPPIRSAQHPDFTAVDGSTELLVM